MEKLPQRKSIRLKNYDYSQAGYYFLTVCTQNKSNILSVVGAGSSRPNKEYDLLLCPKISLTQIGIIVEQQILGIPLKYLKTRIDKYVIMPNHLHFILKIYPNGREDPAPTPTVGQIVGYFKYQTTKSINNFLNNDRISRIWQRNYHDHIIRNQEEYQKLWEYIETNPLKWHQDRYYVE